MRLVLLCAILATALVAAPAALASAPCVKCPLGTVEGATGLVDREVSYVTNFRGSGTLIRAVAVGDGEVLGERRVSGAWGLPRITLQGDPGGISPNGRVLVLAQSGNGEAPRRARSQFLVLDTRKLSPLHKVTLRGDFAFDTLSPNGRTLYLIEHVSKQDLTRYRVRAYDLSTGRLLPGVIADERQKTWLMRGYAVAQVRSGDGRWVYTLYSQPGNYPFVHALDTIKRTAVCIGLPWKWSGSLSAIESAVMDLTKYQKVLRISGNGGKGPHFLIDTKTFRANEVWLAG
jgi:hypothetical protein